MVFDIPTRYEECMLCIPVFANGMRNVRVIVEDKDQVHTLFTNRYRQYEGWFNFYVRMPVCGAVTRIHIFDEDLGPHINNGSIIVNPRKIRIEELEKRMDMVDMSNPLVSSYTKFLTNFAYYAATLDDNITYQSEDGNFRIHYVPYIIDYKTGQRIETPMRISQDDGLIEASKEFCSKATCPGIMALGFHEFSHFYLNNDMANESEADLRGLLIYLGLGYPRIEAKEAFLDTFINADGSGADTGANAERYKILSDFIDNFENSKLVIYE